MSLEPNDGGKGGGDNAHADSSGQYTIVDRFNLSSEQQRLFAKQRLNSRVDEYKAAFQKYDTDNTGYVSVGQLRPMLQDLGFPLSDVVFGHVHSDMILWAEGDSFTLEQFIEWVENIKDYVESREVEDADDPDQDNPEYKAWKEDEADEYHNVEKYTESEVDDALGEEYKQRQAIIEEANELLHEKDALIETQKKFLHMLQGELSRRNSGARPPRKRDSSGGSSQNKRQNLKLVLHDDDGQKNTLSEFPARRYMGHAGDDESGASDEGSDEGGDGANPPAAAAGSPAVPPPENIGDRGSENQAQDMNLGQADAASTAAENQEEEGKNESEASGEGGGEGGAAGQEGDGGGEPSQDGVPPPAAPKPKAKKKTSRGEQQKQRVKMALHGRHVRMGGYEVDFRVRIPEDVTAEAARDVLARFRDVEQAAATAPLVAKAQTGEYFVQFMKMNKLRAVKDLTSPPWDITTDKGTDFINKCIQFWKLVQEYPRVRYIGSSDNTAVVSWNDVSKQLKFLRGWLEDDDHDETSAWWAREHERALRNAAADGEGLDACRAIVGDQYEGFDIDWADPVNYQSTALHLAIDCLGDTDADYEVITFLLDHGADPCKENENDDGNTALHMAVKRQHVNLVEALLKGGYDGIENMQNELGDTPLHLAATNKHKPIIALLVHHGADAEIVNGDDLRPNECGDGDIRDFIIDELIKRDAMDEDE